MIDLGKLELTVHGRNRERTHYKDCYLSPDHRDCAILMMVHEMRALLRALQVARDCLADMHDDDGCKFTDPNADGCMSCYAFEQIAEAEEEA